MLDIHHHQHHHHDPWPLVSNDKHSDHPDLFQPYSLAVIELVEVPPPPRHISSPSSYYFSSEDDDDDSEDDAESAESYCSSDQDMPSTPLVPRNDSFQRCMKRILVWREKSLSSSDYRENLSQFDIPRLTRRTPSLTSSTSSTFFSTSLPASPPSPSPSTSTTLLSQRRLSTTSTSITSAELEMHPCPACDAFFPTLASLRAHGKKTGNEACCVAVEYAFEK